MNKNDKDSHLGALSKLLANEALQKEMVSTEQPLTSMILKITERLFLAGIRGKATSWR
jgi:hypothetical protein